MKGLVSSNDWETRIADNRSTSIILSTLYLVPIEDRTAKGNLNSRNDSDSNLRRSHLHWRWNVLIRN